MIQKRRKMLCFKKSIVEFERLNFRMLQEKIILAYYRKKKESASSGQSEQQFDSIIMQIKELTLPPNQKKITYQITKNGKTQVYLSSQKQDKKPSHDWDLSKIQLGQLNSIQMTQKNQLQNILEKNPFQPLVKPSKNKQQTNRVICCSCKKSKCLKMYCECFAKKLFCGEQCACKGCINTQINAKKLFYIREELESKKQPEQKGCKCQKSGCNKKYCECFSKKRKCGQSCECLNCQNIDRDSVRPNKEQQ